MERPDICGDEHLQYLDELRESGDTNMYGARPYLMSEFPELTKEEALEILVYWAESFAQRHGLTKAFTPTKAGDANR